MVALARPWLLLLAFLLAGGQPARAQPVEQGQLCRAGIRSAEAAAGIPAHLLMAIGRAESGRADPNTGVFHPWPWTINAEGRGSFFPDRAAAIAAVRQLQAQGVRSIDIGCMQINLRHHPNAFASLEEAFDPAANTRYAARFLSELRAELGDWNRASAAYHSRTPEFASRYQARVAELWAQEARNPAAAGTYAAGGASRPAPGTIGGALLANGADRAQVIAAAPGTQGRGLDAYRAAPIALATRPAITLAATTPAAGTPAANMGDAAARARESRAPSLPGFGVTGARAPMPEVSRGPLGGLFLVRRM